MMLSNNAKKIIGTTGSRNGQLLRPATTRSTMKQLRHLLPESVDATRASTTVVRSLTTISMQRHLPSRDTLFLSSLSLSSTRLIPSSFVRLYATTSKCLVVDEYPAHTLFPMPALSPTMETGSIASWTINVGDTFSAGDSLCTIETDKASVDFEAQDDGVLAKILVQPGTDVPIGTPICIVTEDINDVPAFTNYTLTASSDSTAATTTTTSSTSPPPPSATSIPASSSSSTLAISTGGSDSSSSSILFPSARHLAESKGKDATVLKGSGKGGRVTKSDVQIALSNNTLPNLTQKTTSPTITTATSMATSVTAAINVPPPTTTTVSHMRVPGAPVVDVAVPDVTGQSKYEDIPNNKMRKIIASRLTASKRTVPHCYVSMEVALDDIMKLRKQLQNDHGVKISVNDCIIRACALSLRDVPQVNHMYDPKTDTIVSNQSIDVSVAVATPTGLITPIVFHTDQLGLYEITNQVKDLATRARDGQLQPHEYQGGTFSISNLGMFGINEFSAVINPPQAAIMAVGGGTPTLVPIQSDPMYDESNNTSNSTATSKSRTDEPSQPPFEIRNIMTAQLSADRRVIDEATAALFLQVFRHYMQTPELLLL